MKFANAASHRLRISFIAAIAATLGISLTACGGSTTSSAGNNSNSAAGSNAASGCSVKAPAQLANDGILTIGTSLSTPPQDFAKGTKPAGFDIDMGNAIASQMCLKPHFVNMAFSGLFPSLNARRVDIVMAGVGITPPRTKSLLFVPYFRGGERFIVKTGSNFHGKVPGDLCGVQVSTITGSVESRIVKNANKSTCKANPIRMKTYPNFSEALQQVQKGSAKVAYVDWPIGAYIVKKRPDIYQAGSPVISGTPHKAPNTEAVAIRQGDTAMQTAVEKAVLSVMNSPRYEKLLNKWGLKEGAIKPQLVKQVVKTGRAPNASPTG